MSRSAPPLIARLRHRLTAATWLFAFLMLMKGALSVGCAMDGLPDGSPSATGNPHQSELGGSIVQATTGTGSGADCWLADSGGCHCSCAHGLAIPSAANGVSASIVPSAVLASTEPAPPLRCLGTALRPPIA